MLDAITPDALYLPATLAVDITDYVNDVTDRAAIGTGGVQ
jgi:hypothetical protein